MFPSESPGEILQKWMTKRELVNKDENALKRGIVLEIKLDVMRRLKLAIAKRIQEQT